jgi:hypothetical protein
MHFLLRPFLGLVLGWKALLGLPPEGRNVATLDASVTRWNQLIAQYQGPVPLEFGQWWIQLESDGDFTTNYYGACGFMQLNSGEAARLGIDLARTLTDAAYSMWAGFYYITRLAVPAAEASIAKFQLGWSPTSSAKSYWAFVKLYHAYPAALDAFPAEFMAANGRRPQDVFELTSWVDQNTDSFSHYGWDASTLHQVTSNIRNTVQAVSDGSGWGLVVLATAAFVLL